MKKTTLLAFALSMSCTVAIASAARADEGRRQDTAPSGPTVHVESNKPDATLERITAEVTATASGPGGMATAHAEEFQLVCTVPCDKTIDHNAKYVFRNVAGLYAKSGSFILPARDKVELRVNSGSQGGFMLGFFAVTLGIVGAGTGGLFAGIGAGSDRPGWVAGGLVALGVSVPLLIGGIVLMGSNATSVTTEKGETLVKNGAPPGPRVGLTASGLGAVF